MRNITSTLKLSRDIKRCKTGGGVKQCDGNSKNLEEWIGGKMEHSNFLFSCSLQDFNEIDGFMNIVFHG